MRYEKITNTNDPLLVIEYQLFDIILAIMFMRLIFLTRAIENNHIYTDPVSRKVCNNYGFSTGIRFSFKCHFQIEPEKTVISLFAATVFVLAYVLRIFEMPYYRSHDEFDSEFDNFFNSAYLVLITITTVGYGDFFPKTIMGKILAVFIAIFGAFLISMLVLAVASVFDLNKE